MSEGRVLEEAMQPGPGLQSEDFDEWYADMTISPVKDEIQQRHLGQSPLVLDLTCRVMASASAP